MMFVKRLSWCWWSFFWGHLVWKSTVKRKTCVKDMPLLQKFKMVYFTCDFTKLVKLCRTFMFVLDTAQRGLATMEPPGKWFLWWSDGRFRRNLEATERLVRLTAFSFAINNQCGLPKYWSCSRRWPGCGYRGRCWCCCWCQRCCRCCFFMNVMLHLPLMLGCLLGFD